MINKCLRCEKEFTCKSYYAKWCPECKKIIARERNRDFMRRKRSGQTKLRIKTYPPVSGSINDILRDLETYNKEHNTHLSYGKYVEMMRNKVC